MQGIHMLITGLCGIKGIRTEQGSENLCNKGLSKELNENNIKISWE